MLAVKKTAYGALFSFNYSAEKREVSVFVLSLAGRMPSEIFFTCKKKKYEKFVENTFILLS